MIVVTERAAAKLAALAEKEQVQPIIRLGVRGGGCNGYSYVYEFDERTREDDEVWQVGKAVFRCDAKSLRILEGCQLDFETSLLKGGFRFSNPRARQSCSCGESFSL